MRLKPRDRSSSKSVPRFCYILLGIVWSFARAESSSSCPHDSGPFSGYTRLRDGELKCYVLVTVDVRKFLARTYDQAAANCVRNFKNGRIAEVTPETMPPPWVWNNDTMYWILSGIRLSTIAPPEVRSLRWNSKSSEELRSWKVTTGSFSTESRVEQSHESSSRMRNQKRFDLRWKTNLDLPFTTMSVLLAMGVEGPYCIYFRKTQLVPPAYGSMRPFACNDATYKWNSYICETDRYDDCTFVVDPQPRCVLAQSRSSCFFYYSHVIVHPAEKDYGRCAITPGLDFTETCNCSDDMDPCAMTQWQPWSDLSSLCGNASRVRVRPPTEFPDETCYDNTVNCCTQTEWVRRPPCPCDREGVKCLNGGTCVDLSPETWICSCPPEFEGRLCEETTALSVGQIVALVLPLLIFIVLETVFLIFVLRRRKSLWKRMRQRMRTLS